MLFEEMQFMLPDKGYPPFTFYTCGFTHCDGAYHIERPHSSVTCFEYVLEGTGTVRTNGTVLHPDAGDIYLLHQGDDHFYYADPDRPWVKVWFSVCGELSQNMVREYGLRDVTLVSGLDLRAQFEQMVALSRIDIDRQELDDRAAVQFLGIVQKISRHICGRSEAVAPDAALIKAYIQQNLERPITVNDLAALVYRTPAQITRMLKKAFGVTPYEYILDCKIETARHLLINTPMKVKEISDNLSFSDEHYFSNYFKKKVGMSPTRFRALKDKNIR